MIREGGNYPPDAERFSSKENRTRLTSNPINNQEAGANWREQGACRDEDPELFFPVGTSGPARLQTADAKAVCSHCPVATRCLGHALQTGEEYGVWGGMSEGERRAALKNRNASKKGKLNNLVNTP